MIFKVEIDEFYLDEEEITIRLKDEIMTGVLHQIRETLKQKIEEQITKVLREQVEAQLKTTVEVLASNFTLNTKIKTRYSNDPEVSVQEYMQLRFNEVIGESKSKIDTLIKGKAELLGKELNQRYDLLFASGIVSKLSEKGLLKEDAVKLLLA